jgi:arginine exporter protein ArgO
MDFRKLLSLYKENRNNSDNVYEAYRMNFIFLLKGLAIGFSLAAPVGPVGVLCIRRTLAYGSKRGLIVGLSAACADMLYGIVAVFGVTLISDFISNQQQWLRLMGGVLLNDTWVSHVSLARLNRYPNKWDKWTCACVYLYISSYVN